MVGRGVLVLASLIALWATDPVMAEPRDSVDRGGRLDTDALRDDVRTNRLQVPSHPLSLQPMLGPAQNAKAKSRSKASGGSGR